MEMNKDFEDLRGIIAHAVEDDLDIHIKKIRVIPVTSDDGEEMLQVEVSLALSKEPLRSNIMYELVHSVANAIRNSGEKRHPVVMPHLAREQLLGARV